MAKFEYEYNASTDGERREIERIRAAYAPKDERAQKLERLKELNERAKRPAKTAIMNQAFRFMIRQSTFTVQSCPLITKSCWRMSSRVNIWRAYSTDG